ncbi:MAG: hypothetical protein ACTHNU_06505 [Gaiellales bacterium]
MRSSKRLVRTLGVAMLALGLSSQVAQAKPFEPVFTGTTGSQGAASVQPTARPWSPALVHAAINRLSEPIHRTVGPATAVPTSPGATPTVLHQSVLQGPVSASSRASVNWAAVAGGAVIIVLVGALGAGLYRLRPQRPVTA